MRVYVPYARSGPRPRVSVLGALACCQACSSSSALSGLGAADWQVNPAALQRQVRQARLGRGFGGFGSLGLSSGASGAVTGAETGVKAAGAIATVGAGSAAAAGATAGSVVPIVGTAIGAVVGAIVGYLLASKKYFNVGNSNAQCQQLMQAWQSYTSIQGHVAGRALGWSTMQQLFHAAVGAGLFPGNNMHLQFHEGMLACAGHGDWVDDFLGINLQGQPVNNCGAHNCMADAFIRYQQQRSSVPAGTPDAIYFVDSILLPMNQSAAIPWVYQGAQSGPQVHQLFYDLADAYLAQNASGTTPYVEYPQAQTGTPTAGAEGAPTTAATAAPAAAAAQPVTVPYVSPASAATASPPGTTAAAPVPDQTTALVQSLLAQGQSQQQAYRAALANLQAQGANVASPAVQQQVAGAVTAAAAPVSAGSLLSGNTGLILVALGVGGAILFAMKGKGKR